MLKIYVIDGDAARRTRICRELMRGATHPEPFESAEELLAFQPEEGLILAHDGGEGEGEGGGSHALLAAIEANSWLPVMMYGEAPELRRIVGAMQRGAVSYFAYPLDVEELAQEYARRRETLARQSARRRRARAARQLLAGLSLREREILACMLDHGTSKEIARHLGISPRTVEAHRANLMLRLDVRTSSQAIRVAMEGGIFETDPPEDERADDSSGAPPPLSADGAAQNGASAL